MIGNGKKTAAKISNPPAYDARYKVIVLGEATVGKTCLIHAAMGEKFNPTLISTIGVDYSKRLFEVEGYTIQLELWDTAGQERFRSLSTLHYRDAKGFIVVYDVTNKDSFNRISKDWIPSIDQHIHDQAPVFFVGNKSDLEHLREVSFEDGQKLAYQQCSNLHIETSAKTGANIEKLFYSVAEAMISYFGVPKRFYQVENGPNVELKKLRTGAKDDAVNLGKHKDVDILKSKCCNNN